MALLYLQAPSSPHSHLSLSHLKPQSLTKLSFSWNRLNRGTQSILLFKQQLFTSQSSSSSPLIALTTTEEEEEEEEEAKESVVKIYYRRRLIAQNIPWSCTAEDITALFEKHGVVLDVELSMYNKTRNRGLAFITMASEEEATTALNNLNSYDLDGHIIKVEYARTLKKSPPVEAEIPTQKYNVYAGNLAWRVRSQDLRGLFNASGKVISAEVVYNSKPRRPAGYGFVSFASKEEAEAAISSLNGKSFMGRTLRLGLGKLQSEDTEWTRNEVEASSEVNTIGELSN